MVGGRWDRLMVLTLACSTAKNALQNSADYANDEGAPEGSPEPGDGKTLHECSGQLQEQGIDHHQNKAERQDDQRQREQIEQWSDERVQ